MSLALSAVQTVPDSLCRDESGTVGCADSARLTVLWWIWHCRLCRQWQTHCVVMNLALSAVQTDIITELGEHSQQTRLSFVFSSRSSLSHFLAFLSRPLAANFKLNKCSFHQSRTINTTQLNSSTVFDKHSTCWHSFSTVLWWLCDTQQSKIRLKWSLSHRCKAWSHMSSQLKDTDEQISELFQVRNGRRNKC